MDIVRLKRLEKCQIGLWDYEFAILSCLHRNYEFLAVAFPFYYISWDLRKWQMLSYYVDYNTESTWSKVYKQTELYYERHCKCAQKITRTQFV